MFSWRDSACATRASKATAEWVHARLFYMWPHSDHESNCTAMASDICSVCRPAIPSIRSAGLLFGSFRPDLAFLARSSTSWNPGMNSQSAVLCQQTAKWMVRDHFWCSPGLCCCTRFICYGCGLGHGKGAQAPQFASMRFNARPCVF